MSKLGERLTHLRASRGHTQESLAAAANVARSTVSRAENDDDISLDSLRTLSKVLRLEQDEYLSLLVAWIDVTIGSADFACLSINTSYALKDEPPSLHVQITQLARELTTAQCRLLLLVLEHPEYLELIASAQTAFSKLNKAVK